MKTRIAKALLLVLLLLPLSGCPAPALTFGLWLFHFPPEDVIGLILLNGGQGQIPNSPPPEANGDFSGTFTWAQDGGTFTMINDMGSSQISYTGNVNSSTNMNGTFVVVGTQNSGTWTAEFYQP